jgi:hypothetical protein
VALSDARLHGKLALGEPLRLAELSQPATVNTRLFLTVHFALARSTTSLILMPDGIVGRISQ